MGKTLTETILDLDGMAVAVETTGDGRRARLTIDRDGSLLLRTAADVADHELRQFLDSKRDWIYRKLAEKDALAYEPVAKSLVNGEGFLYLGRNHRLRIGDTDRDGVVLDHGRLVLPKHRVAGGAGRIIDWYTSRGAAWLYVRARSWIERLRVEPVGPIEVADLGHKWGAATPGGRVRIHWATMQLRPPLIDYVLAHELAHLREPHHGPEFWQVLARAMPDYEDRKLELARVGQSLWLGAVRLVHKET